MRHIPSHTHPWSTTILGTSVCSHKAVSQVAIHSLFLHHVLPELQGEEVACHLFKEVRGVQGVQLDHEMEGVGSSFGQQEKQQPITTLPLPPTPTQSLHVCSVTDAVHVVSTLLTHIHVHNYHGNREIFSRIQRLL